MIIFIIIFATLVWVAFAFISGWLSELVVTGSNTIYDWLDKQVEIFAETLREKRSAEHEDPFVQYEEEEKESQEILIKVRQAVAQAIATHKQLEDQIDRNRKQAQTWSNRALMALEQNNPELAEHAQARARQYEQSAQMVQEQLSKSEPDTAILRHQLTTLDNAFEARHLRHQEILARQAKADASIQLNELFAKLLARYAEAQNKKAEEKLHGIIDKMPAALMVVNREGEILAVNPQLENLVKQPGHKICESMKASDLFEHPAGVDVIARLIEIADGGICSANISISDGRYLHVDISASHLQSGDLIICIFETGSKQTLF